MNRTKR